MGHIVRTLRGLNISEDDFVYLNYEEKAEVWHISDTYIEQALGETHTAAVLASALAEPGVTVYSRYGENVLEHMREEGLIAAYPRDFSFEDFLTDAIIQNAYDYDLLTISTERQDHKRGTCAVGANIKIHAGELYELGPLADSVVCGWDVVVQTPEGSLALSHGNSIDG